MVELRVSMLGTFTMGDATCGWPSAMLGKAQDLLALILLAPQRSVRREYAAEALWPDVGAHAQKKAVRQALWRIHHATDAAVPESARLIVTDGEALRVNPERRLWLDVSVLTGAARVARSTGPDLADVELARLGRAADLYRGPLLAGCYDEWCLAPRARIDDGCLTLLDTLSRAYERRGALDASIGWAQRLLDIEPAHELTHRRIMRLHYRNGDRTRALRQFHHCRRVLRHELGVAPSAHTRALGEAIMADRVGDALVLDPTFGGWHGAAVVEAGPEVVVLAMPRAAADLVATIADALPNATHPVDPAESARTGPAAAGPAPAIAEAAVPDTAADEASSVDAVGAEQAALRRIVQAIHVGLRAPSPPMRPSTPPPWLPASPGARPGSPRREVDLEDPERHAPTQIRF